MSLISPIRTSPKALMRLLVLAVFQRCDVAMTGTDNHRAGKQVFWCRKNNFLPKSANHFMANAS